MKKLLAASVLALMLTACSQSKTEQPQQPQPLTQEQLQQEVNKAAQECQQELGKKPTREQFDACMSKKGFERINPAPQEKVPAKGKKATK